MIQRIQHLYLFVSAVVCVFMLAADLPYFSTVSGEEEVLVGYANTLIKSTEASESLSNLNNWMLISAYGGISMVVIFLFKNRRLQMRLIGVSFVLSGALVWAMYVYSMQRNYFEGEGVNHFLPAVFLPLSLLAFNVLAYRGVLRDERLIRSMDRLR